MSLTLREGQGDPHCCWPRCRGHSARWGAVSSGRGQPARSGTGILSPTASIVPVGTGMSPPVLECPRWCGVSPGGGVLEWPGTFCAAGCVLSRAGTRCALGDRNPVPDGVECPRPHGNVPGRKDTHPVAWNVPDGVGCPGPEVHVPGWYRWGEPALLFPLDVPAALRARATRRNHE